MAIQRYVKSEIKAFLFYRVDLQTTNFPLQHLTQTLI